MTSDETRERAAAFWAWFSATEARIREKFSEAAAKRDFDTLELIVNYVGHQLDQALPGLGVRLGGGEKGGFQLAIVACAPGAQQLAARVMASAPTLSGWTFAAERESPKNVLVRDQEGRELVVPLDEVRCLLLPRKPDGTQSILFFWEAEFDPHGPLGHLYHAAATELLNGVFGAPPEGASSWALIPAASAGGRELLPVHELADAWRRARS